MSEKTILISFDNGTKYEIPALFIAENRARYYAELDGYDLDSREYFDQIRIGLNDELELIDWLQCNIIWEDLEQYIIDYDDSDNIHKLSEDWEAGNWNLNIK